MSLLKRTRRRGIRMKPKSKTPVRRSKHRRPIQSLPNVYTTSSCHLCDDIDCDDMVQCDTCDLWFHFICVNVDSEIRNKDWSCDSCKYELPRKSSLADENKENCSSLKQMTEAPLKAKSVRSTTSSCRNKTLALQMLEEQRILQEKRDHEYLQQKYSILEGSQNELGVFESDDDQIEQSSFEKTLHWAKQVQRVQKTINRTFDLDDVSISLDDDERTMLQQKHQRRNLSPIQENVRKIQTSSNFPNQHQSTMTSGQPEIRSSIIQPSKLVNIEVQPTIENVISSNLKSSNLRRSNIGQLRFNSKEFQKKIPVQSDFINAQSNARNVPSFEIPQQNNEFNSTNFQTNNQSQSTCGNQFNAERRSQVPTNYQNEFKSPYVSRNNQFANFGSVPRNNPPETNFSNSEFISMNAAAANQTRSDNRFHSTNRSLHNPPPLDFSNTTHAQQSNNPRRSNVYNLGFQSGNNQNLGNNPSRTMFNEFGFNSANPSSQINFGNFGYQPTNASNIDRAPSNICDATNNQQMFGQNSFNYAELCQSNIVLTANQIAARHTMEKKLPRFFGEPKRWQMFESAFINATLLYGLNNSENLPRLQDCLKGDAIAAVQCRLLHPDSVPGVMNTLRLMYGRPEQIIHSLLDEIEKTPSPSNEDLGSLVKFAISVQNLCSTVQSYRAVEHLRNPTIIKALIDKLPVQIKLNWAFYKHSVGDVNLSTLGNWLFELATVASDVVISSDDAHNNTKARKEYEKQSKSDNYINVQHESKAEKSKNVAAPSKGSKKCPACSKEFCKTLAFCEKFKKLNRQERWNLIKNNNLCGGCLGNHRYYSCKQKKKCDVDACTFNHHVLLHNYSKSEKAKSTSNQNVAEPTEKKTCNVHKLKSADSKYPDLFRIVPVILYHNSKTVRVFAYMDDGSNLTTLEQAVAKDLNVKGSQESLCILWSFGNNQVENNSSRISIHISGVFDDAAKYNLNDVRTVNKLILPTQSITAEWLSQYEYFDGIPITTYEHATPQMIIGLRYSKLMVSLETIQGNWSQPLACRTLLGWVVQGPTEKEIATHSSKKLSLNMCECQSVDNNLQTLVKDFFSLESFGVKISDRLLESKESMRARNILELTTIRKNNCYESALLWRSDNIKLPNSFNMAKRRLECVEAKMKKDSVLAVRMCNYIQDFLDKGYIRKLTDQEQQTIGPRTWYLPIFPVFNPKKPDKLRLVWDGAAKVNGVSLNSSLLTGPNELVPLPDILRRFRERKIGITGDIREMYHQIFVTECDQDSQRFLWRDGDSSIKIDVYAMNVMTFGSTCSPCTAQYVKNKNASDFKFEFPKAVETITMSHYVDDMIESAHSVEEAIKLVNDVQHIHQHAGFELRSFTSNSRKVLDAIAGNSQFVNKVLNDKLLFDTERVLGMYWNTRTDTFTYSLQFMKIKDVSQDFCLTKREVLRTVMSVFDPLGFLAHLLIHAKVLLQEIWRSNIDWDQQLPALLKEKWSTWVKILSKVEEVHIPRLYSPRMSPNAPNSIQLHVFVDASLEAYATVAYFRIQDNSGVDSCIVGAKSRVAPNKPISVPRLELQGAVLGNRFAESIVKSHYNLVINKTIVWCDSQTVLSWLKSEPRRYSQFVAFRVGEILDSSENIEWRWIPTEHNVADEATKSKKVANMDSSSRWFVGPDFLRDQNDDYNFELDEPDFVTEEEIRPYYLLTHLEVPVNRFIEYERFSNWQRLHRATAYFIRFAHNLKSKFEDRCFEPLSSDELLDAENMLYKQAQFDSFSEEILIIRWNSTAPLDKQKAFDKSSVIRTCSPYLDDNGVMRVRGRIDAATSISDATKRPIILARDHYMTYLIVYWYHHKYLHLNHQTVLNEIRQKYWIPKLRVVLNGIRNSCQKCKNTSAIPKIPEMASLPPARLATFTSPFTYAGIDYFGPIKVVVNRGTQKRWGVLITCLTTRAIHLEVAYSLDTSSCIMAIENFTGRRGKPRELYSDNGTNFHGADNVLREEFAKLDQTKIQETFTTSEMKWSFNPPTASHMGGIWERMIRIVKTCLDEVLTVRYPSDEVLKSLFIQIENMVNSRPLTYVSLESIDDEVLTPNHFLLGSSDGSKPLCDSTDNDLLRNNWRNVQAMSDIFWDKFVLEYLPTLTRRTKWFNKVEPLKVGDVVILAESSASSKSSNCHWNDIYQACFSFGCFGCTISWRSTGC